MLTLEKIPRIGLMQYHIRTNECIQLGKISEFTLSGKDMERMDNLLVESILFNIDSIAFANHSTKSFFDILSNLR